MFLSGKYLPLDNLDEEQFLDAMADYACDWFQVAARVVLQPASISALLPLDDVF